MTELDKRLKEIIVSITTDHDTDTLEEVMEVYVEQLTQAFIADGWINPWSHIPQDCHLLDVSYRYVKGEPKKVHQKTVLSYQAFLDRFQKELKAQYDSFVDFADIDMNIYNHGKEAMMLTSLDAACRAAGLPELGEQS